MVVRDSVAGGEELTGATGGGVDRRELLKRGAVAGAALVWAVPTVETLTQTGAAAASAAPCQGLIDTQWPDWCLGAPTTFRAGAPEGVYLWFGANVWNMRVTHPGHQVELFTGTIATAGTLVNVTPVKLEHNDHFAVGPHSATVTFRFHDYGWIDGLDWQSSCATSINFALDIDGVEMSPSEVYIGRHGRHPDTVPFSIDRV
jgi:hypothetical protein